jgi:hypothetical protein
MGPRVLKIARLAVSLLVTAAILALAPLTVSAFGALTPQPHTCGGG